MVSSTIVGRHWYVEVFSFVAENILVLTYIHENVCRYNGSQASHGKLARGSERASRPLQSAGQSHKNLPAGFT